jgi:hypothetical protein
MAHSAQKRKCPHCKGFFHPDHRNVARQRYCSKPECRKASKADSQQRWLQKPENHHYFRGPDNVKRIQLWRQDNPGYWRRKPPEVSAEADALQETLMPQGMETQVLNEGLGKPERDALQDSFFMQPAVLVGLIAQLSGCVLQEDIALMARRLQQLGHDILDRSPQVTGGSPDAQTPDLFRQAAPSAPAIQLGGSALGP